MHVIRSVANSNSQSCMYALCIHHVSYQLMSRKQLRTWGEKKNTLQIPNSLFYAVHVVYLLPEGRNLDVKPSSRMKFNELCMQSLHLLDTKTTYILIEGEVKQM